MRNGNTGLERWRVIATIAGVLIGVFWFFVNLQAASDSVRELQGEQLDKRLTKLETSMIEVETQFCASDTIRNLMHASDLRIQSMLWAKSFPSSQLPISNAYYPKIGRCDGAQSVQP